MSKKNNFKFVEKRADFVNNEQKLLKWWYENKVVDKYLRKNEKSKKKFSFLDGPITANNPMGVHHAWGRTLKDVYQRYHNLKGERQRFQNGFDCQGLWVEVEVEKELGFKNKKDIEEYGIGRFVEKCKERVKKYSKIQTEQSKRLGYFMDWDNSYYTMSDENNYTIWNLLKICWQKGWLYKGLDVVPWCKRCGTAISQHEILTEEYKQITHRAVFLKYKIIDSNRIGGKEGSTYLLVWTTTPWTTPGNVAVAVNPKLIYMLVLDKDTNEEYILLGKKTRKDYPVELILKRAGIKKYEVINKFEGEKLIGLEYEGPFDDFPRVKKAKKERKETFHRVIGSCDLVTGEEGTALVHISTGTGREDFQIGKEEKISLLEVVNGEGRYLKGFGELSGKNAIDNFRLVVDFLKKRGFLKSEENYQHRYPTCWRCKEELIFRAVDEWYIAMDRPDSGDRRKRTLREQMIDVARKIFWIPSFGLERELDWLSNMEDWLISKKRYWGLALPIWECKCGHFEVIGSKKELARKAVKGWSSFKGHSPHRPYIDKVLISCPKCGKNMKRILDVGNPWLDAGIVSYSTLIDPETKKVSYMADKKYWRKWFPADFITECFPGQFKNWFYSLIAMSTILERKKPFKTLLGHATVRDEKGEEMHKSKGNAIWFDEAAEKMGVDVMRWMYILQNPALNLNFGYNIAKETRRRFHLILWNVYRFFVNYAIFDNWKPGLKTGSKKSLDRWILSRLANLVEKVDKDLKRCKHNKAAEKIECFIIDLSTWYLRRSRDRCGPAAENEEEKNDFYSTTYFVLINLSKLLAIFTPFLAERIFRNLTNEESVHLQKWPDVSQNLIDKNLEKSMILVREVCEKGHSERKRLKIKVRQPLLKITVKWTKFKKLFTGEDKNRLKDLLDLIKDELNVKEIELKDGDELEVKFETKITKNLEEEAKARELIREIQNLRKKKRVKMDEWIEVCLPDWPEKWEKEIKKKALIKRIKKGERVDLAVEN